MPIIPSCEQQESDKKRKVSKAKKLILKVLEGGTNVGSVIEINANGLVGSKRQVQDGNAYFGIEANNVLSFMLVGKIK